VHYPQIHQPIRILIDVLRPQSPVAGADLCREFVRVRIEELVAQTRGDASLVLETVEHIVLEAKTAEGK
jgi:hypothetical protein